MKVSRKAAASLLEYLGYSTSRTNTKIFSERLSSLISGASRGEKKQFYNIVQNMSMEKGNLETQLGIIRNIATRGKVGAEKAKASGLVDGMVRRVKLQNSMNTLKNDLCTKVNNIFADDMRQVFNEAMSPENMERIYKDIQKEMQQEARTMLGRGIAYPINKLRSLTLPSAFRTSVSEMVRLPKEKFAGKYYDYLLSSKGIIGRAPAKAVVTEQSAKLSIMQIAFGSGKPSCQGGFNHVANTIEFTKEFSTLSRAKQANLLTHELKHFEQTDAIIRTFGVDRYIQAIKTRAFNNLKLKYKGEKTNAEIMQMVEKSFKEENIAETIRTSFAGSSKAPRIALNSELGQKAKVYLDATENYQGVTETGPFGAFIDISKDYLKNPLEVEAYKIGQKAASKVGIVENLNLSNV